MTGVFHCSPSKLDPAHAALEAATQQLPKDATAGTTSDLPTDSGEAEKGIAAFQHVTEIAPNQADAYYFHGLFVSQLRNLTKLSRRSEGLALNAFTLFGI